MAELTLRLITPDAIVLDTLVSSVQVPATDGLLGILPRHAPLVTALDVGPLTYEANGKRESVFVSGGFAEVRDNTVRVVSEAGEPPSEIDEERALEAEKRARRHLDEARIPGEPQIDVARALGALRRAQWRLRVRDRIRS
jgi:F-type H+-transporting ATPase subunit epsilon